MSDSTTNRSVSSSSKRSWRRFTLRSLFLAVLSAAIFFGWVAYRLREFHHRADFVSRLREKGFTRIYTSPVPHAAFWCALAGDDALQVIFADLRGNKNGSPVGPSQAELNTIATWRSLERLYLAGPAVSDETILVLTQLNRLRELSLENTAISDAGLRRRSAFKELESLFIETPQMSGCDYRMTCSSSAAFTKHGILKSIIQLKSLRELGLECNSITDEDVDLIVRHLT
jgi:hypothetical protein